MDADIDSVAIPVEGAASVSGLLQRPGAARACLVLAHGAGAGMHHPFLASLCRGLAALGVATLRYQFPYMEAGRGRPDTPAACHATVRAAVAAATRRAPDLPLIAGGKSFGARMTSQAHAAAPLAHVQGLVFFGFPLHPPKQPARSRAEHLFKIHIPMLFLQGTRDAFAELALLEALVGELGARAELALFDRADHSFHVPARSGRTDAQVESDMLLTLARWHARVAGLPACPRQHPCDPIL